jgi:RNA 3'-terminal phosphate cyclase (ATP)
VGTAAPIDNRQSRSNFPLREDVWANSCMITIDGAARSGSGTIVRYSMALASLLGEEIKLENIRAGRDNPGLRPQHLKVVQACQEMCHGAVRNATVGSKEIAYTPRERFEGGEYNWDIGTAGSTTMMAQTLLPLACFARNPSRFRLGGGLFQDFAPSAYHMKFVLIPFLMQMGVRAELDIIRPGYVPGGGGIIEIKVEPTGKLKSSDLVEQGEILGVKGIALSSHLKEKRVSQRMAAECHKILGSYGYKAEIEEIDDESSLQAGAALAICATTGLGNRMGSDRAGRPGRSSESVGRYVAESFLEDVKTGAAVDRYTADQLIIYAGLAKGVTRYSVPRITGHVETNLWLIQEFLGARTKIDGNVLEIEGIGFA